MVESTLCVDVMAKTESYRTRDSRRMPTNEVHRWFREMHAVDDDEADIGRTKNLGVRL